MEKSLQNSWDIYPIICGLSIVGCKLLWNQTGLECKQKSSILACICLVQDRGTTWTIHCWNVLLDSGPSGHIKEGSKSRRSTWKPSVHIISPVCHLVRVFIALFIHQQVNDTVCQWHPSLSVPLDITASNGTSYGTFLEQGSVCSRWSGYSGTTLLHVALWWDVQTSVVQCKVLHWNKQGHNATIL